MSKITHDYALTLLEDMQRDRHEDSDAWSALQLARDAIRREMAYQCSACHGSGDGATGGFCSLCDGTGHGRDKR